MQIGKYNIGKATFAWLPWLKVDCEYENEKEEHGHVYVQKGWLWFSWTYVIPFGWDNVKESEPPLESDYDGMGNFSRFGNPPKNT